MLVIPVLMRLRQEERHKLKGSLDNIAKNSQKIKTCFHFPVIAINDLFLKNKVHKNLANRHLTWIYSKSSVRWVWCCTPVITLDTRLSQKPKPSVKKRSQYAYRKQDV